MRSLAQSNSILELDAPAREAALNGLALTPPEGSPVQMSLMVSYAETVYDVGRAPARSGQAERARPRTSRRVRRSRSAC